MRGDVFGSGSERNKYDICEAAGATARLVKDNMKDANYDSIVTLNPSRSINSLKTTQH